MSYPSSAISMHTQRETPFDTLNNKICRHTEKLSNRINIANGLEVYVFMYVHTYIERATETSTAGTDKQRCPYLSVSGTTLLMEHHRRGEYYTEILVTCTFDSSNTGVQLFHSTC